ncbi:MAG TPA: hypothetical protein DCE41_24500 [Cytophagales bacterium]|nr:hypothetical protein [Cytophagales bacterium]HAA21453.1 hypothetical protein [Cytophagales bacterium]HAP65238.1 hypothetical protein [Cytophagales bacterium]
MPTTPLQITTNPAVNEVFEKYPEAIQEKMDALRALVIEVASELEEVTKLEETLKWGEPSYLTKHGSTIRMDWKEKSPDQYAMYFKCTSLLVPSFRTVYPEVFQYEGNRAIVFGLEEEVPREELKQCIKAGLRYHKVKHLPLLGL